MEWLRKAGQRVVIQLSDDNPNDKDNEPQSPMLSNGLVTWSRLQKFKQDINLFVINYGKILDH